MNKPIILLLLNILILSCKPKPEELLPYVAGYWQIEKVQFPDGSEKEFEFNGNIDFIELNDSLKGYRRKLKPLLDGRFEAIDSSEELMLKLEHDSLNAYYSTPYAYWKETILMANGHRLKVVNQDQKTYFYKRFQPQIPSDAQAP